MTLMLTDHETAEDKYMERRRGLRIRQNRPVKVYDPTAGRYFGGKTEDVSSTGLRIELPAWATVRTGETLNVHVGLSSSGQSLANRRQMMPARVVWVNRHESVSEAAWKPASNFLQASRHILMPREVQSITPARADGH